MQEREFKQRLEKACQEANRLKALNDRFVNRRMLVFFVGALLVGGLLYRKSSTLAIGVGFVFIAAFIFLMARHNKVKRDLRKCEILRSIYEDFLKRINGGWTTFPDTGEEFLTPDHPYSSDLNIFGAKSLFQLINLTHTFKGRHRLATLFSSPDCHYENIIKRQGAVKELSAKLDFIEELTLRGMLYKKTAKDPEGLFNAIRQSERVPAILKSPVLHFGLPLLTLASALLAGRVFPWLYLFFLSGLILQLVLFAWSFKTLSPYLGLVHQYKNELETYQKLIELIEEEDFADPYLNGLKGDLLGKNNKASSEIKRITALSEYIDFKHSPLIYFILNALFLWDFHLYRSLERWKKDNTHRVDQWLEILGEYEALASLSALALITPVSTYPDLTQGKPAFSALELSHPYIPYEKRIPNNVTINGVSIITGSNMSGKTTLLRTVGTNLVLAYAGAPVCAKAMSAGLMSLFTSMRNIDDLSEGVSTFYAELLRIKKIVDSSRKEKNMIFLIDEIFKGTNSKDRIEGAKIVLRGLNKPWTIGLISTHDYELCDLEAEDSLRFSNLHFTESYSNNRIHFDYKLHKGRCKTSNARYLMKMVGLE